MHRHLSNLIIGSFLMLSVVGVPLAYGGQQPAPIPPDIQEAMNEAQQLLTSEQAQCQGGKNPQACERAKVLQAQIQACRGGDRGACAKLPRPRR
jgi:hypothetical protein